MCETVSIRTWTEQDIEYVVKSIAREKWGHTKHDVERCWSLEPDGCFIAEMESEPVGHVSTICYGKLAWIGLLIVTPEQRGKGIGTALMHEAVDYLTQVGAETIKLEAEETAVSFYERLGFKKEFASLRFSGLADCAKERFFGKDTACMQREDIDKLAVLDSKYFGSRRLRVLKKLFEDNPRHCFVARKEQEPIGYIMCRRIQNALWIGPWICGDSSVSGRLLDACKSDIKDKNAELRFGFPSLNECMERLMKINGFVFRGKSIRMLRGESEHHGIPGGVYGIAGPEKG